MKGITGKAMSWLPIHRPQSRTAQAAKAPWTRLDRCHGVAAVPVCTGRLGDVLRCGHPAQLDAVYCRCWAGNVHFSLSYCRADGP